MIYGLQVAVRSSFSFRECLLFLSSRRLSSCLLFSSCFFSCFFGFIRFVSLDSSLFSSLCVARPVSFLFVCLPVYLPFGPSSSLTGLSLRLSRSLSLPLSVSPSCFLASVNFSPFLSLVGTKQLSCFSSHSLALSRPPSNTSSLSLPSCEQNNHHLLQLPLSRYPLTSHCSRDVKAWSGNLAGIWERPRRRRQVPQFFAPRQSLDRLALAT